MIQNISIRLHPDWSGKISELVKTREEMKSNPGVTENSAILSSENVELSIEHPYSKIKGPKYRYWENLKPTMFQIQPYSLCAKPYAWLMFNIDNDHTKPMRNLEKYGIEYNKGSEKSWVLDNQFETNAFVRNVGFRPSRTKSGNFLQLGEDQNNVIGGFFKNVKPGESLCFVYAKSTDFSEKPQRILVGIGRVKEIEYPPIYDGDNPIKCQLWETRIQHSISSTSGDCVLLPYDELQEYAKDKRDFNIDDYVVFASDDFRGEFSYGAEWVSYDAAIDTILRTINSLNKLAELLDVSYDAQIQWLESCVQKIYQDRWIYPGLAEVFYAFGLRRNWENATQCALQKMKEEKKSFNDAVESALMSNDEHDALRNWRTWNTGKKKLFELLCRMSLNETQAFKFFKSNSFCQWNGWVEPQKLINNPYLIYEQFADCREEDSIPFVVVDNAIFPHYEPAEDETQYTLQDPSKMSDSEDGRRVHALIVKDLKKQTNDGNSLYPARLALEDIRNEILSTQCLPSDSILDNVEKLLQISDSFQRVDINLDGKAIDGFQLKRNVEIRKIISQTIEYRLDSCEDYEEDWENVWNRLKQRLNWNDDSEESENRTAAKKEKLGILPYMAKSRIFVLTGGAGTGKTTLLSCLASSQNILNGKILAIAPTGKAMVRLRESLQKVDSCDNYISYKTIAQLLLPFNRFNPITGRYDPFGEPNNMTGLPEIPGTVIVDECSMLTEEMLAALFKTLGNQDCRIILSGDANQLPPIGCGRPFLDILTYFKERECNPENPHFGEHFGELLVSMRQDGTNRTDLAFAQCFKRGCTKKDLKFLKSKAPDDEHLKIEFSEKLEDIETKIINILNNEILSSPNQYLVESCDNINDWEILSPTRRDKFGTIKLNEIVRNAIPNDDDESTISNNVPKKIRKGEKIICTQNGSIYKARNLDSGEELEKGSPEHYVANGDLGYIVGCEDLESSAEDDHKASYNLIYKGQEDCYHRYPASKFNRSTSGETDALLEYAYALTVHKCQGSQFKKTLVVLNKYSPMLSRELLYTAFSRQEDKLVVLFNDDFSSLGKYCSYTYSEMAKRMTNLFITPELITEAGVCYDSRYMKQDDEVNKIFLEQKQKESATVIKPVAQTVSPTPVGTCSTTQKKQSIFSSLLQKIKSIFVR